MKLPSRNLKRSVKMISVNEALNLILSNVQNASPITKTILDCQGMALAENIEADRDYPPFNRVTMDGYAVLASDINVKKIHDFRVIDTVFAGTSFSKKIPSGSCVKIMTGAPLPEGVDAVIKVEDCVSENGSVSFNIHEIQSGYNVARKGEDVNDGKLLIPKGQICDPAVIGILATTGNNKVQVYPTPSVSIISTGDEVVPIDQQPLSHQIRDLNSYALQALLWHYQIRPQYIGLVHDKTEVLKKSIAQALEADIVIISGGVSKGDADIVPDILISLGVKEIFHRVKIKPGKPIWFGKNEQGKVVFGLPGNPMSCQVGFKIFIEPYIRRFMGLGELRPLYLPLEKEYKKRGNREEYFSCKLETSKLETSLEAQALSPSLIPVDFMGSGDITATLYSDGIARRPDNVAVLEKGAMIKFFPWRAI